MSDDDTNVQSPRIWCRRIGTRREKEGERERDRKRKKDLLHANSRALRVSGHMEGSAMESDNRVARSEDDPALQGFFSPKRVTFRYLGLLLMCLIGFGESLYITVVACIIVMLRRCKRFICSYSLQCYFFLFFLLYEKTIIAALTFWYFVTEAELLLGHWESA